VTTLQRYVAYQVPGVAFVSVAAGAAWWAEALSGTVAGGVIAVWVAKDAALYPVVRRSYAGRETPHARLVGTRGEVRVALDPEGWVWVRGELWRAEARSGRPLEVGRSVVVRGVEGMLLVVEAEDEGGAPRQARPHTARSRSRRA
jgi:membrane protein implicated in regulation of membrane protease activity